MKSTFRLVSIFILLALMACADSSNSPDEPDDEFSLIISAPIGSEGGDIETEDIRLSIPQGSFSSTTDIKIYESSSKQEFGSDQVSSTYSIEGLPADYSQPLTVSIKYDGQLSGTSMLAVGEENIMAISDEPSILYSLFEATESGGYLTAEIPCPSTPMSSARAFSKPVSAYNGSGKREATAVTNYDTPILTSKGHFKIHFPSALKSVVEAHLGLDLENSLDSAKKMGFDIDYVGYPINVYVGPLKDHDENRSVAFMPIYENYSLYVDKAHLADPANMYDYVDAAAGREVFQILFSVYDPYFFSGLDMRLNLEHYWFHVAVSVWSEKKALIQQDPIPVVFWGEDYLFKGKRGHAPFEGLQKGIKNTRYEAYKHGCGMAPLIKYLVETYGEDIIIASYNEMLNQGGHPITVLRNQISDPITEWWPAFLSEYMTGKYYKYQPLGIYGDWVQGLAVVDDRLFSIKYDIDTYTFFSWTAPDIGARDYYIHLNYPGLDQNAMLKLTMTEFGGNGSDLLMRVYGYGMHPVTQKIVLDYYDEVTNEISITNIKDLMDNDITYIVPILINGNNINSDYTGDRIVGLEIEVLKPDFNYDRCTFFISFNAQMKTVDATGTTTWATDMGMVWTAINGSFSGNKYSGDLDPDAHFSEEGTIEIILDPKTKNVTDFSVNTNMDDGGITQIWTIESIGNVNIPMTWESPFNDGQENEINGATVCGLAEVDMIWSFGGTTQNIESISCDANSQIRVVFENTQSNP